MVQVAWQQILTQGEHHDGQEQEVLIRYLRYVIFYSSISTNMSISIKMSISINQVGIKIVSMERLKKYITY